jgi:signal peptidase I
MKSRYKTLVLLGGLAGIGSALSVAFGLIQLLSVPTGSMTPAIAPGDHVLKNGFVYLVRRPRRGDIVVYRTVGIPALPQGEIYCKRVVGVPGDVLRLNAGDFYVNDKCVVLSNAQGRINYPFMPRSLYLASSNDTFTVPPDQYFTVGDNAINSYDSRMYGAVPARNITGRIVFCYWPPGRAGGVK